MTRKGDALTQLAQAIVATRPVEIDCDEWLARVGRLIELERAGAPIPPDLAVVRQHLAVCPECAEEFEALVAAVDRENSQRSTD